jgi:amino acid adenylation domain-containing protein
MSIHSKLDLDTISANGNFTARTYWKNRLAGLELSPYFNHPGHTTAAAAPDRSTEYTLSCPANLNVALNTIAASGNALHILLLGALQVLAAKCSSLTDIVIFTPLDIRRRTGDAGPALLPVRMSAFSSHRFREFLPLLKDHFIRDLDHAAFPAAKMFGSSPDELRESPLTGMSLQETGEWPIAAPFLPDIFFAFSRKDTLILTVRYKPGKFLTPYIEKLASLYFHLLSTLLHLKDRTIRDVEWIPPAEKLQILTGFNHTKKDFPRDRTIIDLFLARAAKQPDKIAVQIENNMLTYAALNAKANLVAQYLLRNTPGKGSIVAVQLDRSLELMIALFGILKAGCIYLPLTTEYPAERVRYLLEDSQASLLLTTEPVEDFPCIDIGSILATEEPAQNLHQAKPDDIAYLIYTSGSTGKPKGVLIRHRSLVNRLNWMQHMYDISHQDIILQKTPVVFDVSIWELFLWCLGGASLVLAPPGAEKDPDRLCTIIAAEKITILHFVPSMLSVFLAAVTDGRRQHELQSIRELFASGEELHPAEARLFLEYCPRARLHNLYGPTEATVDVSFHQVSADIPYQRIPIGKPIDNTSLFIFNSDLQLQPIGFPGELYIGGENLSSGYLNQPELTAARFVRNPLDDSSLVYRTGDLAAWLPDGSVEFFCRIDSQVKIRGNRIEIGEIEQVIGQFTQIRKATVLVSDSGPAARLIAYLVANPSYDEESLRSFLATRLPIYMIPAFFVVVDQIPVTVNGKTDRKKLLAIKWQQSRSSEPPSSDLEKELAVIWTEALGPTQFGIDDSFFRIGGDSIRAIKVIGAINNRSAAPTTPDDSSPDTTVSLADFYAQDTIRKLAAFIASRETHAQNREDPAAKTYGMSLKELQKELARFDAAYREKAANPLIEAAYPMRDVEKAMWYIHKSRPGDIIYFEQMMQPIHYETFRFETAQKALDLLIEKHAAFRSGFDLEDSVHLVYKKVPSAITLVDLGHLDDETQKQRMQSDIEQNRQSHFESIDIPLWRMTLYRLGPHYHELLFEYHHSLFDGWSFASFLTEFNNTYGALLRDPSFIPEKLASDLRDCILQELHYKQDPRALDYWRSSLKGFKKLKLSSVPAQKEFTSVRETYSTQLVTDLEKSAARLDTTVKTLLLAAYVYSMRILSCEEDILVGLVTFSRPVMKDGEKILGCFLNTIPFRIRVSAQLTWTEHIRQVDRKLLEIRPYEHLSLFEINQAIGARTHSGNPLLDTLFNFVNWHVEEEMKLEKMADKTVERIQFDTFLRGHTFFDVNYNINAQRMYCMHEYVSPFINEETFRDYTGIFNCILREMIDTPGRSIDTAAAFWRQKIEKVYHELNSRPPSTMLPGPFPLSLLHLPNVYGITGWQGEPDIAALEKSLHLLTSRHSILRTRLVEIENGVFHRVTARDSPQLRRKDLRAEPRTLDELIGSEEPFEPGQWLFRPTLAHITDTTYQLILVLHATIADACSAKKLAAQCLECYNTILRDGWEKAAAITPALQYDSYASWQLHSLPKLEPYLLSYWQPRLYMDTGRLELPGDYTGAVNPDTTKAILRFTLEHTTTENLKEYALTRGILPEMAMLAVLAILLHRYSRQEELLIGVAHDNRTGDLPEDLIGPVSHWLAISGFLPAKGTFDDYVAALRDQQAWQRPFSAIPHGQLLRTLFPGTPENIKPPFNVLFRCETPDTVASGLSGPSLDIFDANVIYGQASLGFFFRLGTDRIDADLLAAPERFDRQTLEGLARRFCLLAHRLTTAPNVDLAEISLLTNDEEKRILQDFNAAGTPALPVNTTIIDAWETQVDKIPAEIALVCDTTTFTYNELNIRANRLAAYLREKYRVCPDDTVAIRLDRSEWLLIAILGVLKAGAAYVPIDPSYPRDRTDYILTDSQCSLVIDETELNRFRSSPEHFENANPEKINGPADLAYVMYTSGSTGRPKGVMIEHRNVLSFLQNYHDRLGLDQHLHFGAATGFTFDISVLELLGTLIHGTRLVLITSPDPKVILDGLTSGVINALQVTPSRLQQLLDAAPDAMTALRRLKLLLVGGESLPPQLFYALKTLPDTRVINVYGPTETTIWSTSLDLHSAARPSIGSPLAGETVYIVDNHGNLVPPGIKGEICIAGTGLARGYRNQPTLTAGKFVADPFQPGRKMYLTGDLGRWLTDGTIEFLGRMDNQVKIRGHRIEPGEIEAALNAMEGIRGAAVTVMDRAGEKQLVAYYLPDPGLKTADIRRYLAQRLPAHMLPASYVALESLPMTPNGKLDRKALPEPGPEITEDYTPPAGPVEGRLTEIWADILKLDKGTISVTQPFFELGGHSLKATILAGKIERTFQVSISVKDLFERSTIRQLAELIVINVWLNKGTPETEGQEKMEVII